MKLTLRKAHKLVNDLTKLQSLRFVSKNIHHSSADEKINEIINETYDQNSEAVQTVISVINYISKIRIKVQEKNALVVDTDSIDSLLNSKVLIESQMKAISSFSKPETKTEEEKLEHIINEVKDNNSSTSDYRSSYTTVSGVSTETSNELYELYYELKSKQEEVIDKLSYLNNFLVIELSDEDVQFLKKLRVL